MTQNIYDNAEFFEGYSNLPRSISGLNGAPEWPAIRAMLPEMGGFKVVDLGCGFGWFCRWARDQGAAHILGIDVSEKMLQRAIATTSDSAIEYRRSDLETLALAEGEFDLAYSSLALHYVEKLDSLVATVHRALKSNGWLVISMEHPSYTASTNPQWIVGRGGESIWPLDHYSAEGPRETDWLTKGVLKYHRTMSSVLNMLIDGGFTLKRVAEFCPTAEQIAVRPELARELERPIFLMIAARRL